MKAVMSAVIVILACGVGLFSVSTPAASSRVADAPAAAPTIEPTALAASAIAAVVEANGGKPPATGVELWKALGKVCQFAQLPVVFSAVRLDSGIHNPRVVIAPVIDGLSDADAKRPNLDGRLFLAANMEREVSGDPRVVSVEFISWNSQRRRFDFGMIENMGGGGEPELRIVDGGKCFSCHKNRGPILGSAPWSNTTHDRSIAALVGRRLNLVPSLPPGGAVGVVLRDRIDGMALAASEANAVDKGVRLGTLMQLNRQTFQLMNRSPLGRKAFVGMLLAITARGPTDPNEKHLKAIVDEWGDHPSYRQFSAEWTALARATNTGMLVDFSPHQRARAEAWTPRSPLPIPQPPPGGFRTPSEARSFESRVQKIQENNQRLSRFLAAQEELVGKYDAARSEGLHGLPSKLKPSNPRAFVQPSVRASVRPSDMVNPLMLAGTVGLTEGDRSFLIRTLKEAVERVNKPKVTAAILARAVFEGPLFAEVLAGASLPDRDEFKDLFVAGLQDHLKSQYPFTQGIPIKRTEYASGPAYDPRAVNPQETALEPTTACLRCHEVRDSTRRVAFESIPQLPFDPFDRAAREAWVKKSGEKRRLEVLRLLAERLHEDRDMPPEDSPEHALFRVKDAAAFEDVKVFLTSELGRLKK
jgi:hypothetical protein